MDPCFSLGLRSFLVQFILGSVCFRVAVKLKLASNRQGLILRGLLLELTLKDPIDSEPLLAAELNWLAPTERPSEEQLGKVG